MAWFKVVANKIKCDGAVHLKGEMFESFLDLDKRAFKGIVERIDPAIAQPLPPPPPVVKQAVKPVVQPPSELPSEKEESRESPPTSPVLGDDVTELFPSAEPEGYKVFLKDDLYFVQDPEVSSDDFLNPQGLKKSKVNDFIRKVSKD